MSRKIWSNAQFNFKFTNGTIGSLTGSYDIERGHPMERCEVAGINGRFVIDDMYKEATLYPAGDLNKTVYTNPTFGGMQSFNDTFKNRIKSLKVCPKSARPRSILTSAKSKISSSCLPPPGWPSPSACRLHSCS